MMSTSSAETLSSEAEDVRQSFVKAGATTCARPMASTIMFLADNRPMLTNRAWKTKDANQHTIITDFVIKGTKSAYSRTGTVTLTPVSDRCVGSYTVVTTLADKDCASAMLDGGFTPPQWKIDDNLANGDGGQVRIVSLEGDHSVKFFFNDLPKGCEMTKRESLDIGPND